MRSRDALESFQQGVPQRVVFDFGGGVFMRRAGLRAPWKQALRRERRERVAPRQFAFLDVLLADLLEQGQQARAIMVLAFLLVVVLGVELVALESGSDPVGRGDDPLQEGVRPVVALAALTAESVASASFAAPAATKGAQSRRRSGKCPLASSTSQAMPV